MIKERKDGWKIFESQEAANKYIESLPEGVRYTARRTNAGWVIQQNNSHFSSYPLTLRNNNRFR